MSDQPEPTLSVATWQELLAYPGHLACDALRDVLARADTSSFRAALDAGMAQRHPQALNDYLHSTGMPRPLVIFTLAVYQDWVAALGQEDCQRVLERHLSDFQKWMTDRAVHERFLALDRGLLPLRALRQRGAQPSALCGEVVMGLLIATANYMDVTPLVRELFGDQVRAFPCWNEFRDVDFSAMTLERTSVTKQLTRLMDAFVAVGGPAVRAQWTPLLDRALHAIQRGSTDPRLGPLLAQRVAPSPATTQALPTVRLGSKSLVGWLVSHGTSMWETAEAAKSALTWLHELGVELDAVDSENDDGHAVAPLWLAVRANDEGSIEALLDLGADPSRKPAGALSPLQELTEAVAAQEVDAKLLAKAQAAAARAAIDRVLDAEASRVAAPNPTA